MKVKQIESKPENFLKYVQKAEEIINSWPDWKKKTRGTSYPRELIEEDIENVIHNISFKP